MAARAVSVGTLFMSVSPPPLLRNESRVRAVADHMRLGAAVPEQVLDLSAIFRVVEHVAHRSGPPAPAPARRHAVLVEIVGSGLEGCAAGFGCEYPAHNVGTLVIGGQPALPIPLVADRRGPT